jgi:hypothetical protein
VVLLRVVGHLPEFGGEEGVEDGEEEQDRAEEVEWVMGDPAAEDVCQTLHLRVLVGVQGRREHHHVRAGSRSRTGKRYEKEG